MPGELRDPLVVVDPLTEGVPAVRSPLVNLDPLTEGTPDLRSDLVMLDPLTEGNRNLRVSLLLLETLHPVSPESFMSTTPFPGFGNNATDPSVPQAADPFNSPLPGLAFSVHKRPNFKTNIDEAASGNEVRTALQQYPRWEFELTYEFLEDRSGAESSLKTILGFFLEMLGSWDTWLFKDPDDYLVTAGVCGTADGVTTQFPLCRTMGGFVEKVGQVDQANDINVYLDAVLVDPADYTVTMPNLIVFDTAPAPGSITADFQFFYACRFLEDSQDYEKFIDKLWTLQSCSFKSVIQ
jgi:uncharacterized protein (TIGR02217 family)